MKNLHVAVLSGLLLAAPTVAQSGAQRDTAQKVSTRGLDLGTERGQKELDRRIAIASREVCGVASSADAAGHKKVRLCRVDATKNAAGNCESLVAKAAGQTGTQAASSNRE